MGKNLILKKLGAGRRRRVVHRRKVGAGRRVVRRVVRRRVVGGRKRVVHRRQHGRGFLTGVLSNLLPF